MQRLGALGGQVFVWLHSIYSPTAICGKLRKLMRSDLSQIRSSNKLTISLTTRSFWQVEWKIIQVSLPNSKSKTPSSEPVRAKSLRYVRLRACSVGSNRHRFLAFDFLRRFPKIFRYRRSFSAIKIIRRPFVYRMLRLNLRRICPRIDGKIAGFGNR